MAPRLVSAVVFAAATLLSGLALAQTAFDVSWANSLLSVRAANAPLADVVGEVARVAGLELIGRDKLSGQVSVEFSNLPIREALAKLLGDANYLLQGDAAQRIVLSVSSMAGAAASGLSGPVHVAALDAYVTREAEDAAEDKETEFEDPDCAADLREEIGQVSRMAADGAFGPDASITSLLRLISHPNEGVVVEALKALAGRPLEAVVKAGLTTLVDALDQEDWDVKTAAVELLGRATDRASLQALGALLKKGTDREPRITVLRVLALRADPASAEYLRPAVKDSDPLIQGVAGAILAELERREREREQQGVH